MNRLSRRDIQVIVDRKTGEGKIPMANRLRTAICAFSRWAYLRGHTDVDVGLGVQKAGRESSRRRSPSLSEVREIWAATYSCGALWGPYFRLCILTGQPSRQEILNMRWDWIDFDKKRLEIPTTKNNQPHIVHLHETALQELKDMKRRQLDAGLDATFVFTTTGKTASSGVSRAKTRLDRLIATNRQNQGITEEMEHWVLHDLRRFQATTLAEEGFSERVADRIQNHVAGGSRPSVVSAVYMLADLLPERARAIEHWGDLVVGSDPD